MHPRSLWVIVILALSVLGWLAAGYVIMSFVEWTLHRHHMHRRGWFNRLMPDLFTNHQAVHHPTYLRNFESAARQEDARTGVYMPLLFQSLWGLALFAPMALFVSWVGACCFYAVMLAHALLWNLLHSNMHKTADQGLKKYGLYRFFYRYHLMHHWHPNANFNIVCVLADFVAGTYLPATPAERERMGALGV